MLIVFNLELLIYVYIKEQIYFHTKLVKFLLDYNTKIKRKIRKLKKVYFFIFLITIKLIKNYKALPTC